MSKEVQMLRILSFRFYDFTIGYKDIINQYAGIAIQFAELHNSIESLITEKEKRV
jgi:hypothetical protein